MSDRWRQAALLGMAATVVLGYVGPAWLGAVPVAAAALYLAGTGVLRSRAGRVRPLGVAGMAALFLVAVLSSLVLPSPAAPGLLQSLAASTALGAALAGTPARLTVRPVLAACTATAAGLLTWLLVTDPKVLSAKSRVFAAVLGFQSAGVPATAVSANAAGVAAAVAAAGWLGLAAAGPGGRRPAVAGALVAAATLGLADSRGAILALVAGAAAVAAWRWRAARWALAAAGVAGAVALLAGRLPIRLETAAADVLLANPAWGDAERLVVWRGAVAAALRAPLLGTGIGSFPFAYVRVAPDPPDPIGAHNAFLEAWLDLGAAGPLLLAALTAVCVARCVRWRRAGPEPMAIAAALVAWLVASAFESTVFASWVERSPWIGWHEVAQPLAFALWGLALSPLVEERGRRPARSPRPAARRPLIAAAAILAAVGAPLAAAAVGGDGWSPPPAVTAAEVAGAASGWLAWCTGPAAPPAACPQRASDLAANGPATFAWSPGAPLTSHVQVHWSADEGVFVVEGVFTMRYRHVRATPARLETYAGDLRGYFIAGLRPRSDQRAFGAYALDPAAPAFDGFSVVAPTTWQLDCCARSDLVASVPRSPPAAAAGRSPQNL